MCFLHRLVRRQTTQPTEQTSLLTGPSPGVTSIRSSATTSEPLGTVHTPTSRSPRNAGRRCNTYAIDSSGQAYEMPPMYERSPSYTPTPTSGEMTLRASPLSPVPVSTPLSPEDAVDVQPPAYPKPTLRHRLTVALEGDLYSAPNRAPSHRQSGQSRRCLSTPLIHAGTKTKSRKKRHSLRADLLGHSSPSTASTWSLSSASSGLDSDSDSEAEAEGELSSPSAKRWWAASRAPVRLRS